MRVLGLDYGDAAIGVAICDELGLTAQGLETLRRDRNQTGPDPRVNRIARLAAERGVSLIVLGYPKNMNNTEGEQARKTLDFMKTLEAALEAALLDVKVVLRDERLTSATAERVLLEADVSRKKRGKVIDQMAAVIILQGYLDEQYRNRNKTTKENAKDNIKEAIQIKRDKDEQNGGDADFCDSIIHIKDENGAEIEFCVLDELERNGLRYVLVVDTDLLDSDEAEAVILKEVADDKDDIVFEELDDSEFETIAKLFDERLEDYEIEF